MRVVLYARNGTASFEAVAVGCGREGHEIIWQRPSVFNTRDVVPNVGMAVVDGIVGKAMVIREAYESLGIDVMSIDEALEDFGIPSPANHNRAALEADLTGNDPNDWVERTAEADVELPSESGDETDGLLQLDPASEQPGTAEAFSPAVTPGAPAVTDRPAKTPPRPARTSKPKSSPKGK